MYKADRHRKEVLVEHGFRLPSALENRPLTFDEFNEVCKEIIFVSATPGSYELSKCPTPIELVVRPTGLLDPEIEIRPLEGQLDDVIDEIKKVAAKGERTLVTTLTKKNSERLADYLSETGIRAGYLHSELDALERVRVLNKLRDGKYDCIIGINLLREGIDLPEVALVAILDADKEGFLRSERSLVQTAGRAARNQNGRVILYADNITDSMKALISLTSQRREKQIAYNKEHNITPKTVQKAKRLTISDIIGNDSKKKKNSNKNSSNLKVYEEDNIINLDKLSLSKDELALLLEDLTNEMTQAAEKLEFERAAQLRDRIKSLTKE
jgi:excinuclease ABC subunit B